MEDQVQFKVFTYWNEDGKPEVRRFGIDKGVVTSFHYLNAKLQDVFPGLNKRDYSVSWKDEEGDDVTLSSDNEVIIALLAMQHQNIMKLYITCKEKKPQDGDEIIRTAAPCNGASTSRGSAHYGVVCDGCNSCVVGFRYKCTTCEDYDLCSKCETAQLHPKHCMIRVPIPNAPRAVIRAAFKKSRHILKSVGNTVEEERGKKRGERSTERRRHGYRHHVNDNDHRRTRVSWLETFANYVNEFADLAGDVKIDTQPEKPQELQKQENHKPDSTPEVKNTSHPQCPLTVTFEDLIKNASNVTSNLQQPAASASAPATATAAPQTPNEYLEIGQGDRAASQLPDNIVKSDNPTSSTEARSREGTPEADKDKADGWTVINREKDFPKTSDKGISTEAPSPLGFNLPEEFQERLNISQGQNIYPPLNTSTTVLKPKQAKKPIKSKALKVVNSKPSGSKSSPFAPTPIKKEPQPQFHPMHIEAALNQMIAMGFTNEGEWLTQLLESKNGNIAAVLDLLTPVNPKK